MTHVLDPVAEGRCFNSDSNFVHVMPDEMKNGAYKQSIVPLLSARYPGACIVMPHPAYYKLIGAIPVNLPVVDGVTYTPMASSSQYLQRLCGPEDIMATYHGDYVEDSVHNGVLHIRELVDRALMDQKTIVFLGKYICDLSYVCLMPM